MIKRILVGLAGTSYTESSIRTALDIAQRHGAEITGVTAIDAASLRDVGPVPIGAGQEAKELREHRKDVTEENVEACIEMFSSSCKEAGVTHQVLREEREKPFDYLISQSRYHDLTVVGLQGIFEYGVPSGNYEDPALLLVNLLTEGLRPIIAVTREHRPVKRVLVAYSGSVESASTLKRFCQLQPVGEVELRLVTFGKPERCQHLLEEASKYCRVHGYSVETQPTEGSAQGEVLKEADAWNADLIVMGNSAKNLLLRRVLGETALHAIRNSELPLFLAQ